MKNGSLLCRPKERNWDPCWCFDLALATSEHHLLPVCHFPHLADRAHSHQYPKSMNTLATSFTLHAWQLPHSNSAVTVLNFYKTLVQLAFRVNTRALAFNYSVSGLLPRKLSSILSQNSPHCTGTKYLFNHTKALPSQIVTPEPNLVGSFQLLYR